MIVVANSYFVSNILHAYAFLCIQPYLNQAPLTESAGKLWPVNVVSATNTRNESMYNYIIEVPCNNFDYWFDYSGSL